MVESCLLKYVCRMIMKFGLFRWFGQRITLQLYLEFQNCIGVFRNSQDVWPRSGKVSQNLRDLPSPTLAIVAERLKLSSVHEGVSDTVKMVTTSMPLASKGGLKNGKHGPNDRGPNVGKAISQRGVPARTSVTMISSQDSLQSQALFNIKDSNKEDRGDINLHCVSSTSRQTSTSHERIRELEERLATQELDAKAANERYQQDLNAKLVAQQQEIEELRTKQQEEFEAVKKDQQDKTTALEKRQQEIDAMVSYLVRTTSESSQASFSRPPMS